MMKSSNTSKCLGSLCIILFNSRFFAKENIRISYQPAFVTVDYSHPGNPMSHQVSRCNARCIVSTRVEKLPITDKGWKMPEILVLIRIWQLNNMVPLVALHETQCGCTSIGSISHGRCLLSQNSVSLTLFELSGGNRCRLDAYTAFVRSNFVQS